MNLAGNSCRRAQLGRVVGKHPTAPAPERQQLLVYLNESMRVAQVLSTDRAQNQHAKE